MLNVATRIRRQMTSWFLTVLFNTGTRGSWQKLKPFRPLGALTSSLRGRWRGVGPADGGLSGRRHHGARCASGLAQQLRQIVVTARHHVGRQPAPLCDCLCSVRTSTSRQMLPCPLGTMPMSVTDRSWRCISTGHRPQAHEGRPELADALAAFSYIKGCTVVNDCAPGPLHPAARRLPAARGRSVTRPAWRPGAAASRPGCSSLLRSPWRRGPRAPPRSPGRPSVPVQAPDYVMASQ